MRSGRMKKVDDPMRRSPIEIAREVLAKHNGIGHRARTEIRRRIDTTTNEARAEFYQEVYLAFDEIAPRKGPGRPKRITEEEGEQLVLRAEIEREEGRER